MANAGSRAENRTLYSTLDDGLDAMGIHDDDARKVVLDFVNEVLTSSEYRSAFHLTIPGMPTDFESLLAFKFLQLWTTPSMQYLALGGSCDTVIDFPVDGYEIIAQANRSQLVVNPVLRYRPRIQIQGRTIPYPNSKIVRRAASPRRAPDVTCLTCHQVLPGTGVCDTCT